MSIQIKLMIKRSLLFFVSVFFTFGLTAGEIDDLKKVNEVYSKLKSLSMNISIETFAKKKDTKAVNNYKGIFKRQDQNMYSTVMGRTMIYNKSECCFIDDEHKLILLGDIPANVDMNKIQQQQIYNDSTLLDPGTKYKYLINNANQKKIEIINPDDMEYEKVELTINAKTFFIEEVTYYYLTAENDPKSEMQEEDLSYEKVKVKYENINLNYKANPADFSLKAIVSFSKKETKGVGKYNNYKVIDQRASK